MVKLPLIPICNDWNFLVTNYEVFSELLRLKKKSGPKSDLPSRLYRSAAISLASPLCTIINESIDNLIMPTAWKNADVTPIPKSLPVNFDDLRPISVLSVPSKMTERFILNNMKPSFYHIMDNSQFAYRCQSSSTCALIEIVDSVAKNLDHKFGAVVAMVTVDFSKAFDQIDHGILLLKLLDYDRKIIPNDFIVWLKSYLTGRTQQVVLNGVQSKLFNITSGVPQGSILGPFLFNIFVSDLKPLNCCTKIVKFADDTTILIPVLKNSIVNDCNLIGNEINNVLTWAHKNNMTINTSKSKILYFRRNSAQNCILPHEFFSIKCCSILKLLGVTLNEHLNFKDHFEFVLKKASQRLYFLRILKPYRTKIELWRIYFSIIRSILEYAAPIFMALPKGLSDNIEKLQRRAHRIICGEHCVTCNIPSLSSRRIIMGTRLFNKIKNDQHPLIHLVHSLQSTRKSNTLILPQFNCNFYKQSFVIQNILLHNNIVQLID
jgi:hypothetical protein